MIPGPALQQQRGKTASHVISIREIQSSAEVKE
jgi:hypothetical protein